MSDFSEIFKSSPAVYLKYAIRTHLKWLFIIFLCLCLIIFILGLNDLRWVFVGLIMIFLILPIIIFNAYFFYLLTPEARRALSLKRIKFESNGGLKIEYYETEDDDNFISTGFSETIESKDISEYELGNKNILVKLKKSKLGFLIIPTNSLNEKTFEILREKIKHAKDDS